jgi:hypothetical protein
MGYMHIDNLYREQTILLFRECYALEKIHGTSAHVTWKEGQVRFSPGAAKHATFVATFDVPKVIEAFVLLGHESVTVYGEAYGGKQQGQKWRYGDKLKFVAFDVQIGGLWLAIPQALDVVTKLGLEFVHFAKVSTDLAALDAERDAPSEQARRNGIVGDQPREGVVLRPLIELRDNSDSRIICKHKRAEERETATERPVVDPALLAVLTHATEIADEWVTPTRLAHVLDKLPGASSMGQTKEVIAAMIEDVLREGADEIADSKEARTAIGKKTAELFKAKLKAASAAQEDGETA